jgi:hypothetical protein
MASRLIKLSFVLRRTQFVKRMPAREQTDPSKPNFDASTMKQIRQQKIEEEHAKRVQSAPDFNPENDTSYEDNYMMMKVIFYTTFFVYGCYKIN